MSKRSQTNVSQHNKALEVMLKYFDVLLFVSLVLFLDCADRFCLSNKFHFFLNILFLQNMYICIGGFKKLKIIVI
jgi:hypothetical protein